MGTAKRERQKANRQLRLEELAKQARKQKSKRLGLRIGGAAVVFIAIVGAVYLFGRDDNKSTTASTTIDIVTTTTLPLCSTAPVDSSAPSTTVAAAPAKPTVTLPTATPTELKVTTLRAGSGVASKTCDTVEVYYVGVLSSDGTEFDENYTKGQGAFPVTIGETGLIEGWTRGLVGLQAGGQYQLDIPAVLGYGDQANGNIPANSALTFVIDIVSLTPGVLNTVDTTAPIPTGDTTVPGATVLETTVPQTTVPQTTVPQTTVPQTTVAATTTSGA